MNTEYIDSLKPDIRLLLKLSNPKISNDWFLTLLSSQDKAERIMFSWAVNRPTGVWITQKNKNAVIKCFNKYLSIIDKSLSEDFITDYLYRVGIVGIKESSSVTTKV